MNPNQNTNTNTTIKNKGIKQIKHYKLIKEIGHGANGTVFLAFDTKLNKLVAIKSIPNEKLKDSRKMNFFKREIKSLYNLKHPNVVKLISIEKTVNNIYIILEYSNCGTLYDLLIFYDKNFKTSVSEKILQGIIKQVVDGLSYMHARKMIHRDIKLENILINFPYNNFGGDADAMCSYALSTNPKTILKEHYLNDFKDMEIKIADLGYARELEGAGVASTVCGTPITMAPDVLEIYNNNQTGNKNINKYNEKADLWSLGSIMYELLVGTPPFLASQIPALVEKILNGTYSLPQNLVVSVEAITFVNGLLTFNSDKRFGWDEILKHPFINEPIENFHPFDLSVVQHIADNKGNININTKDCNNFLWILYKNANIEKLDQMNTEMLKDQSVMASFSFTNNVNANINDKNDKKSLLNKFRKGVKESNENFNSYNNNSKENNANVDTTENNANVDTTENIKNINNDSLRIEELKNNLINNVNTNTNNTNNKTNEITIYGENIDQNEDEDDEGKVYN